MTEAAPAATAAPAEKPWFEPLDTETKGYLQNKGLATKNAVEAFTEASRMHREAERLIGAPANEILRLPKDVNSPAWKDVWKRLGAPGEPAGYDFSSVKYADGKELDAGFVDTMRAKAAELNLTKDAATRMVQGVVEWMDKGTSLKEATKAETLLREKAALKANWGANDAANRVVATAAAQALGIDPATVSALEGVIGYAKIMEMFRTIGTKIGEDKFVNGGPNSPSGVMTREQAVDKKASLKRDQAWVARYLKGGQEETREMTALDTIISASQK